MIKKKYKLDEICEFINGGAWTQNEYSDTGVPVIQVTNLQHGSVELGELKFLNVDSYDKYKKHELKYDDLVIATVGSHATQPNSVVGRASNIPKEAEGYLLNQNAVCIRSIDSEIEQKFLIYLGKSKIMHDYIISRAKGSANQVRMAISALKEFEFDFPDIQKQKKISKILSSYDDLIENNTKRIKLLEESVELIYKEWFVNLRFVGYEKCNIVDGVPEDWIKTSVNNVLSKHKRKTKIKKELYLDKGNTPVIDQSRSFIGGYTNEEDAVEENIPSIIFGDHTRIVKYIDFKFASGADGTQLIYSNNENISQEYLYFAIRNIDLSDYAYARHFKYLKQEEIYIPNKRIMEQFTKISKDILTQISTLRNYNEKLKESRDILIPRLISGEIEL